MNHGKSMATPGSKGPESSRHLADSNEKSGPQEHREFRSDRTTLRHCIQYEGNHERVSRTDHSLKTKLKRIARYLKGRQRCVLNFPCVEKLGDVIHDRGCRLGWRPKDKVLCVWWSVGNRSVLTVRHWSVTQATVSLSSAESEAKAITKGCLEALCVAPECTTVQI